RCRWGGDQEGKENKTKVNTPNFSCSQPTFSGFARNFVHFRGQQQNPTAGPFGGLRAASGVELSQLLRMADFALWATACEPALWPPGPFARLPRKPPGRDREHHRGRSHSHLRMYDDGPPSELMPSASRDTLPMGLPRR